MQTITRKFLAKQPPNLTGVTLQREHRFYLYRKSGVVVRVQSCGETFELEKKVNKTMHVRESEKIILTKDEFETIQKFIKEEIQRDSYIISERPKILIRTYHGVFEGLVRVEVSFSSAEEAQRYTPLDWMGKEISDTPLAFDETLLNLTSQEFRDLLRSLL